MQRVIRPKDSRASRGADSGYRLEEKQISSADVVRLPSPVDPAESLSTTGRAILGAARRLVAKHGFGALSIGAVAEAANEHKSTVMYHFKDKNGLVAKLTDLLIYELTVNIPLELPAAASRRERLHVLIEAHAGYAKDSEYWRALFDLLPFLMRDKRLQAKYADVGRAYCSEIEWALDLPPGPQSQMLASLIESLLDGLVMESQLLGPGTFDLEAHLRLLESILAPFLDSLDGQSDRSTVPPTGTS